MSIWYDWKNDGPDPAYNENNFGTVTANLQPKPSYIAAQTLTRQLEGNRVTRRLNTGGADDFVVLCLNPKDEQKLVAWTLAVEHHEVTLDVGDLPSAAVTGVDIAGKSVGALAVNKGQLKLDLTESPQYVTFTQPSRKLAAAGSWKATLLTPLVTAGLDNGLRLAVNVHNPFAEPTRFSVSLVGMKSQGPPVTGKADLPPQGSAEIDLVALLAKREPEVTLTLEVKFQLDHGQGVSQHGCDLVGHPRIVGQDDQFAALEPFDGQFRVADDHVGQAELIELVRDVLGERDHRLEFAWVYGGHRCAADDSDGPILFDHAHVADIERRVHVAAAPGRDADGLDPAPAIRFTLDPHGAFRDGDGTPPLDGRGAKAAFVPAVAALKIDAESRYSPDLGAVHLELDATGGSEVQANGFVPVDPLQA